LAKGFDFVPNNVNAAGIGRVQFEDGGLVVLVAEKLAGEGVD
jgi:hypothetical protein